MPSLILIALQTEPPSARISQVDPHLRVRRFPQSMPSCSVLRHRLFCYVKNVVTCRNACWICCAPIIVEYHMDTYTYMWKLQPPKIANKVHQTRGIRFLSARYQFSSCPSACGHWMAAALPNGLYSYPNQRPVSQRSEAKSKLNHSI